MRWDLAIAIEVPVQDYFSDLQLRSSSHSRWDLEIAETVFISSRVYMKDFLTETTALIPSNGHVL